MPGSLARGLEYAHRDHLVQPARVTHPGRIPPVHQERRPPGGPVGPDRQRAHGQVRRAAAQVARVREAGPRGGWHGPGTRGAEPPGRVFVRGRLAGVDAVEVAAAGERQPGRPRSQPGLGQPVGGAVLEYRRGGQVPQHVRVAEVAGPVRPFGQCQPGQGRAGRHRLRGELEPDFPQREGRGGLPSRGGEQRGPGDPAAGRVACGRVDGQVVAVLGEVGPDPQPVPLAGGKRAGRCHPAPARPGVAIMSSAQNVISSSSVRDCGATPARRVRPLVRLQLVMSTRASSSSSSACRTAGLKNLRLVCAPESLALRKPETIVSRITRPLPGSSQKSPIAGLVVP